MSYIVTAHVTIDVPSHAIVYRPPSPRTANDLVRGNRDVVLSAVRQYGMALQFVSDAIQEDGEIVEVAIRQHHVSLTFGK